MWNVSDEKNVAREQKNLANDFFLQPLMILHKVNFGIFVTNNAQPIVVSSCAFPNRNDGMVTDVLIIFVLVF